MTRYASLAALLLCAAAVTSCDEDAVQTIGGPAPGARIRFFNFGVGAPEVNFYADDTKMTAISSTTGAESTRGVAYGGVGSGGYYAAIAPGDHELTGRIAAATDKDLPIATVEASLEDGRSYSFYMSGFYDPDAKTVDGFVVEDPLPAETNFQVAHVRFVNAISNSSPMTLYATSTTTDQEVAVGGPVAYQEAGAFTSLPPGTYDLATRTEGSATDAIVRTGVSFSGGRFYTIGARGDMTVTDPEAAKRPFLDNTANR